MKLILAFLFGMKIYQIDKLYSIDKIKWHILYKKSIDEDVKQRYEIDTIFQGS